MPRQESQKSVTQFADLLRETSHSQEDQYLMEDSVEFQSPEDVLDGSIETEIKTWAQSLRLEDLESDPRLREYVKTLTEYARLDSEFKVTRAVVLSLAVMIILTLGTMAVQNGSFSEEAKFYLGVALLTEIVGLMASSIIASRGKALTEIGDSLFESDSNKRDHWSPYDGLEEKKLEVLAFIEDYLPHLSGKISPEQLSYIVARETKTVRKVIDHRTKKTNKAAKMQEQLDEERAKIARIREKNAQIASSFESTSKKKKQNRRS